MTYHPFLGNCFVMVFNYDRISLCNTTHKTPLIIRSAAKVQISATQVYFGIDTIYFGTIVDSQQDSRLELINRNRFANLCVTRNKQEEQNKNDKEYYSPTRVSPKTSTHTISLLIGNRSKNFSKHQLLLHPQRRIRRHIQERVGKRERK